MIVESRHYLKESLRKDIVWNIFKFFLFLAFIQSLNPWFVWNLNDLLFTGTGVILCILYVKMRSQTLYLSSNNFLPMILLVLAKVYVGGFDSLNTIIFSVLAVVPILLVLALRPLYKTLLLEYITKYFAFILLGSLTLWVILLIGVPLPSLGTISHPSWEMYIYENYFFVLRNMLLYDIRFNSIFLEPGQLGMICSFLLLVNKFDFKRRSVLVILIANLFTLSLAAYFLLFFAYGLHGLSYSKYRLKYSLLFLTGLLIIYTFSVNYNAGNNIVNELIISRLEYDESEGGIVGNNRFSESMDNYYEKFIVSEDVWLGIGGERFNAMEFGANAGYKVFLVKYGLLGTLLVFLFYLLICLKNRSTFAYILLIVYVVAFLQRAYPLWTSELILFITSTPVLIKRRQEGGRTFKVKSKL